MLFMWLISKSGAYAAWPWLVRSHAMGAAKMGYTAESFRFALSRAAAAAWMRDQILASVPGEAEQVHARQILLRTEEGARRVEQNAKTPGTNFATLAAGYDLVTRGDLYWFPRGYLNEPAVEDAAFSLQPGEISGVIQSNIGYHVLQVVALNAGRRYHGHDKRGDNG